MAENDATNVRMFLDSLFVGRTLVDKEELVSALRGADLPEEISRYAQDLPPGHYGHEELRQRLIGPVTAEIPTDFASARARTGRGPSRE